MNPRLTDIPLEQRDFERVSGLSLNHFRPDSRTGIWLVVGAIAVAVAGVALYWGLT